MDKPEVLTFMKKTITIFVMLFLLVTLLSACGKGDETAMTIGETPVGYYEFRYVYNTGVANYEKNYAAQLEEQGLTLDFKKPFDEQEYKDGKTWAEYFNDCAKTDIINTYCWYGEALADGITLTDEDKAEIDSRVELTKVNMAAKGTDESATFGKGMTFGDYQAMLERRFLSNKSYTAYMDTLSYTFDDCYNYASENFTSINYLECYYYHFPTVNYASAEDAKAAAEAFLASVSDASDFERVLYDTVFSEEEKATFFNGSFHFYDVDAKNIVTSVADWATDPSRVYGDKAAIQDSRGYATIFFINYGISSAETCDIRRLFVSSGYKDKTPEEGKLLAKAETDEILEKFAAAGSTEDAFISLVKEHSDDKTTITSGGLYADSLPDRFGNEHCAWLISPERTNGDFSVFETESGFELIYYIGKGDPTWYRSAEKALKTIACAEYTETLYDKYPVITYDEVIAGLLEE